MLLKLMLPDSFTMLTLLFLRLHSVVLCMVSVPWCGLPFVVSEHLSVLGLSFLVIV